jgi:hypothetical protein
MSLKDLELHLQKAMPKSSHPASHPDSQPSSHPVSPVTQFLSKTSKTSILSQNRPIPQSSTFSQSGPTTRPGSLLSKSKTGPESGPESGPVSASPTFSS